MARQIVDGKAPDVPIEAAKIVGTLSRQALDTHIRLREIDRDLLVWLRSNDVARRLTTIPGICMTGRSAGFSPLRMRPRGNARFEKILT
jgi:transposase